MKVRLLVNLAGPAMSGAPGDVRDVNEELARKFIDAGLVEPLKAEKPAPQEKPAQ